MSGIHNYGTATVDESAMSGNFADSQGGGILNEGHLTVSRSTLTGNSSNSYGGAISSNATSPCGGAP
jgi:predicted outer membrane repeat protein